VLDRALVARDQPPTIVHPCEASLHLPAVAIIGAGSNRPPACGTPPTACHRRDGRRDAAPSQLLAQGLAVVGAWPPRAALALRTQRVDHGPRLVGRLMSAPALNVAEAEGILK
jgi:hypothetical protein